MSDNLGVSPAPIIVVAHLNARLQPFQRGHFLEDPLDAILKKMGIGEVMGGGTALAPDPVGVSACDVEIAVKDGSETVLKQVMQALDLLGAPKGAELRLPDGAAPIAFGVMEGMAIFMNGTDLPAETYARSDINKTIEGPSAALGQKGELRGYWEGDSETALYFYGSSFAAMQAVVADCIQSDPLCARCRIEQIA
ncbi:hypothetical protein [Komagataeibacter xylinus]|uniref:hypothetical protein n=1 Tax=Komagataeibacter xylinus TaxID=28448 RepID=UPI0010309CCB|nr:hypothetical protein [Komagataeibacter xylinus]